MKIQLIVTALQALGRDFLFLITSSKIPYVPGTRFKSEITINNIVPPPLPHSNRETSEVAPSDASGSLVKYLKMSKISEENPNKR